MEISIIGLTKEPALRFFDMLRASGGKANRRRAAQQWLSTCRFCEEGRPRVFPWRALWDGVRSPARIGTDEGVAGRLQETTLQLADLRGTLYRAYARTADREDRFETTRRRRILALQRG